MPRRGLCVSVDAGEIHTIFATVDGESRAQALADAIEKMDPEPAGVGCFEVDEDNDVWEVAGYFGSNPAGLSLTVLEMAFSEAKFVVSKVPPEDWVAKVRRELTPVRAGRFTLHGGHDEGEAPPSAIRLQIEAAMAFGTGHHGTTRGCLLAMDTLAKQGLYARRVLDLGTGTGALAMGAAKLWKAQCIATDIDEVAVATARENVRFNGTSSMVQVYEASRATSPVVMRYARQTADQAWRVDDAPFGAGEQAGYSQRIEFLNQARDLLFHFEEPRACQRPHGAIPIPTYFSERHICFAERRSSLIEPIARWANGHVWSHDLAHACLNGPICKAPWIIGVQSGRFWSS